MTFVIITAGIDLSVGSILAFAGVVLASALRAGLPIPIAILVGLGTGMFCGLVNGALIVFGKLPPFFSTLGMMSVARGAALMYAHGRAISGFSGLLKKGKKGLADYGNELRDSGGTEAEIAANELDNRSGEVTLFNSALSGNKIDVSKALEPLVRNVVALGKG